MCEWGGRAWGPPTGLGQSMEWVGVDPPMGHGQSMWWVWGPPMGHWQSISSHNPKGKWLFHPHQPSAASSSSAGAGALEHLPHPCGSADCVALNRSSTGNHSSSHPLSFSTPSSVMLPELWMGQGVADTEDPGGGGG